MPGGGFMPGDGAPPGHQGASSGGFGIPLSPKSLARVGLGAYGDTFLGAGSAFVSNNYAKYFSSAKIGAYFDVTEAYVAHKLKLILCPFIHRGSWARVPAHGGPSASGYHGTPGGIDASGLSNAALTSLFKPPREDINAPDLYVPLMGFWSYALAASMVRASKNAFTPELVATHFTYGAACWFFEAALVWASLRSLSGGRVRVSAPWLDVAAYTGYAFVPAAASMVVKLLVPLSAYASVAQVLWGGTCSAVFMVKTVKRVVFSEARHHARGFESVRAANYVLLALALAQIPVHWVLGRIA